MIIIKLYCTKDHNYLMERKTFYLDDDPTMPITAGGILLYRTTNGLQFLIEEIDSTYEDIGGKCDSTDPTIFSAVAREVEEETNGVIKRDDIMERLEDASTIKFYSSQSKYVIYLVKATEDESNLTKEEFGDIEIHDKISRTIGWVSANDFISPMVIQHKLNCRLRNKALFDKIRTMNELNKFRKNIMKKK